MTQIGRDQASFGDNYPFGNIIPVPGAGSLQLLGPGSTLVGARIFSAATLTSASIQVDAADSSRAYNLSIRVNGVEVATLALPAGAAGASRTDLSIPVAANDLLTAFLVKTSGAGISTFTRQYATVGK